jgi:hypothetical protein
MIPASTRFYARIRRELAVKAVNRLIADVEAKRLLENKELAELIAACVRETALDQLQTLKSLIIRDCALQSHVSPFSISRMNA